MDDKEQAAIDALRASGLEAEACAVEILRANHRRTLDGFHAAQRASYKSGQEDERSRCAEICDKVQGEMLLDGTASPYGDRFARRIRAA